MTGFWRKHDIGKARDGPDHAGMCLDLKRGKGGEVVFESQGNSGTFFGTRVMNE